MKTKSAKHNLAGVKMSCVADNGKKRNRGTSENWKPEGVTSRPCASVSL